jgi:hypothetical protein
MFSHINIDNKFSINYLIIESMTYFLKFFDYFAKNKKVLIISPFSKSVEYQYKRKDKIFKDYVYPEFELITYTTPITYNNSNDDLELYNVKNNWMEQSQFMANEISLLDFDIALLSCGSYAYYLGDFIAHKMNKKAIYLGGILNMYFNIYGQRYDRKDKYFENIVNIDYQIKALESNKFNHIRGGRKVNGDSFKAYF